MLAIDQVVVFEERQPLLTFEVTEPSGNLIQEFLRSSKLVQIFTPRDRMLPTTRHILLFSVLF